MLSVCVGRRERERGRENIAAVNNGSRSGGCDDDDDYDSTERQVRDRECKRDERKEKERPRERCYVMDVRIMGWASQKHLLLVALSQSHTQPQPHHVTHHNNYYCCHHHPIIANIYCLHMAHISLLLPDSDIIIMPPVYCERGGGHVLLLLGRRCRSSSRIIVISY